VENHRQPSSGRLDIDQGNILLRSTIDSDRKFWSGERRISAVQAIGLLLMFFGLITAMWHWPKGEAPWWEKLVSGNGAFLIVFGGLVFFVLLGNRWARRKSHTPDKH
jgi:hypothetical protein